MSPDDLEVERQESSRTTRRQEAEAEPTQENRHAHLRANPGKRKGLYALIIFLALGTVALALADILVPIDGDSEMIKYVVFGLIALLFLWALFMLFSRRRGEDEVVETEEQMQARLEMERALIQCPDCKSVFQFGQIHFRDNKRTAFSCPVCGVYSRLPDPDAEPVKVLRPEGEFKELQYHCNNCGEDLAIGTFGDTPLHLVRFRACPSCGERGHIERVGSSAPPGVGPAPDDAAWGPA